MIPVDPFPYDISGSVHDIQGGGVPAVDGLEARDQGFAVLDIAHARNVIAHGIPLALDVVVRVGTPVGVAKTFTFIMTHIWFYAISKKTGDSKMHCRKCGSEAFTKNGFVAGTQRYKCKQCGFQFTRETSHGKPMKDKILALILYLSGMSMNMIGKIVGVSTQSVMRWINMFYEKFAANDESQSNIEEIEVDEMVSYITKKKITSGSGKLLIITLENLSAGNVVIVVPKP